MDNKSSIEMVDAFKFDMKDWENMEIKCGYIEKFNIMCYYYPDTFNKSIRVFNLYKNPIYEKELKSVSNSIQTKISIE
jgi:hypothetical protein